MRHLLQKYSGYEPAASQPYPIERAIIDIIVTSHNRYTITSTRAYIIRTYDENFRRIVNFNRDLVVPIFAIRNIYSYRVYSRDKEKTVEETNETKQQKTKEKKNSRLNGLFANWVFRFMVSIYLRRSVMQIGEHDCWLICSKRPLVDVGIALRGVSVLIRVFSSIKAS